MSSAAGKIGGVAVGSALARLARTLERLLFAAVLAALVASVFVYHRHWMPLLFPAVRHVQLHGQFIHIDRFEVERLVQGGLGEHFFDTDLYVLKRLLETMPWVRHARVTRVWPQTLRVEIKEHDAAARWGLDALISEQGVVFTPARINADGLPTLYASPGLELTALERYRTARELLADDSAIRALGEDRHGPWSLLLDGGILVKVGDEHWESRFKRFADAWRGGLHAQAGRIRCVDLRYPDGFAVMWKDRAGGNCR